MSKREDTLLLEKALFDLHTKKLRNYSCEEVTIGFHNQGLGNEIVDFMSMDSKGTIKCYEIKVTLQDLKSKAKKSWYGHYNYLVVSKELYEKVNVWIDDIPSHIGILVGNNLESKRKAKKCQMTLEEELILKESMVRSMFYKMLKYKDAQSIEEQKKLHSKIKALENDKRILYERATKVENIVFTYETYKAANDNLDIISLEKMANAEKEKYWKNNPNKKKGHIYEN